MATLGEMLSDVYEDCGHNATPPAAVVTRIRKNINKAYRLILGDPALNGLRDRLREAAFLSTAGMWNYRMPANITRVLSITDRAASRRLEPITLDWIRDHDPGFTASGSPWAFVDKGHKPSSHPVSDVSSGLWVVSASAADISPLAIEVNAVDAAGRMTGDLSATLNGTTRVQIGTGTDYGDIQSIRLSAVCAGVVDVYNAASGGNIVATIAAGKLAPTARVIQLYPTPSATVSYDVDGEQSIVELDDTADVPILPEEFHDVLTAYARMKEYEKMDDGRRADARDEYEARFSQLKWRMNVQHGQVMAVGGARLHRGVSRTGGMFPVDTF